MNHQQILNKLSRGLVGAILYDVARLTSWGMLSPNKSHTQLSSEVIAPLLLRWNCVLHAADNEVRSNYKDQTCLALAVALHKHGFQAPALTQHALCAIDLLNQAVALSDSFFRASDEIKNIIVSPPTPLVRRPLRRKDVTFWRAGEAASMQIEGKFYAVYIHEIVGAHEAPVVELYDFVSTRRPKLQDLAGLPAKGRKYQDGIDRAERFLAYGMRDVPDPANQFHLIARNVSSPTRGHLGEPVGLYAVSDVFRLLEHTRATFGVD